MRKLLILLSIIILFLSCATTNVVKRQFVIGDCLKVNPDKFPKTMHQSGIPFKVIDIGTKVYILKGLHPDFYDVNLNLSHKFVEVKFFKSSCKFGKETYKTEIQ